MKFEELIYTLDGDMVVEISSPADFSSIIVRRVNDLTVKDCKPFIGKSVDMVCKPDGGTTFEGTAASVKIILSFL